MLGTYNYVPETRIWDTQSWEHTYILLDMQPITSLHNHTIRIVAIVTLRKTLLTRRSTLHHRLTQQFYIILLPITRHGYDSKNHRPSVDESGVHRIPPSHHLQAHSQSPRIHCQPSCGLCLYLFHSWTGIKKNSHLHPFPIMEDLLPNLLSHPSSNTRRA